MSACAALPLSDATSPAAILALGEPASAAAARVARELVAVVEAATLGAGGPRTRFALAGGLILDPLEPDILSGEIALLTAEAQTRVNRLKLLSVDLERIAAGLNQALAEVRTLRMRQSEAPFTDELQRRQTIGLLSSRIIQLESSRQSVLMSRALLVEMLSAERLAAGQLASTDDAAEVLAIRQSRMLMLAERARRSAAMAGELDAPSSALPASPAAAAPTGGRPRSRRRPAEPQPQPQPQSA